LQATETEETDGIEDFDTLTDLPAAAARG